ncbi:DUF2975 domain-containing protein [uncultured Tateyamaria sp.]|uniref:DUF2975 domain-containing protein n=1 Tax=Tateyamaria sp. 1078 TaxID=3417464 RepID=UPI00262E5B86|nr:DUF2975 domain-containing protein [uncultured Tateyamaria sp.]
MTTERIARRARVLAAVTTVLIGVVPLAVLIVLASAGADAEALRTAYGIKVMPDDPDVGPTMVWLGVEALRLGLFLWILWCVRGWLTACGRGQVFAGQTARHVQRIGTGLLMLAVAHVLGNTIIIAALTWNNPAGQRSLAIGFGSTEVLLLLAAGLMTLFGWIQSEAARLSAENEGFV